MAERLPAFPNVRSGTYPWEEWTDGSVWRVKANEDFKCPADDFRRYLYQIARKRGLTVFVQTKKTFPHSMCFQFVGPGQQLAADFQTPKD